VIQFSIKHFMGTYENVWIISLNVLTHAENLAKFGLTLFKTC